MNYDIEDTWREQALAILKVEHDKWAHLDEDLKWTYISEPIKHDLQIAKDTGLFDFWSLATDHMYRCFVFLIAFYSNVRWSVMIAFDDVDIPAAQCKLIDAYDRAMGILDTRS